MLVVCVQWLFFFFFFLSSLSFPLSDGNAKEDQQLQEATESASNESCEDHLPNELEAFLKFCSIRPTEEWEANADAILAAVGSLSERNLLAMVVCLEFSGLLTPTECFRQDSFYITLLKRYTQRLTLSWFRESVYNVFRRVMTGQTGDGSDVTLDAFVQEIIKGLGKKTKMCPEEVAVVLQIIEEEFEKRFSGSHLSAPTAFLFLQVLVPSIVNPSKSGLIVADLDMKALKTFAALGKSTLKWANAQDGEAQHAQVRKLISDVMKLKARKKRSSLKKTQLTEGCKKLIAEFKENAKAEQSESV